MDYTDEQLAEIAGVSKDKLLPEKSSVGATPSNFDHVSDDDLAKIAGVKLTNSNKTQGKSKGTIQEYKDLASNAYDEQKKLFDQTGNKGNGILSSRINGDWRASPLGAAAETGANMATSLGASAYGGLKGLIGGAYGLAKGDSLDQAAETATKMIQESQQDHTYQPSSATSKLAVRALGAPVEALSSGLGSAGGYIGEKVNGEKGRLAGEAIGETLGQSAPLLFGLRKTLANRGNAGAPKVDKVPVAGEDYSPLRKLGEIDKQRLADQSSIGVQPTLGGVLRTPEQLRFENLQEQQTQTPGGAALRQRTLENNQAMLDSLDKVKGESAGKVAGSTETGLATRDALLEQRSADSANIASKVGGTPSGYADTGEALRSGVKSIRDEDWSKVGDLFDKARSASETQDLVDVNPLKKFFEDNAIEAETVAPAALKTAQKSLENIINKKKVVTPGAEAEVVKRDKFGIPVKEIVKEPDTVSNPVTVEDMELLRAKISKIGRNTSDGSTKHWAGEVVKQIDQVTDGKGGDYYQTARRARYDHEQKFNQPEAIQRVLGKSSDTDYRHATEDLFNKSVVKGSEAELSTLIDTLKSSPNGAGALSAIKKQAVDHARINGIDSIGERKLNALIGQDATNSLKSYHSKYTDNSAIARLLEKSTESDYRISADDVFKKSVIGASPLEIKALTDELGKTPKGKEAINQLKISAIDHLMDGFTKTVGKNEAKVGNAGTSGLQKAIAQIGEENLRTLLGDKDTNQILKILRVSDDLTTNSSRLRGSSTATNAQTILEQVKDGLIRKSISKVPKFGSLLVAGMDLLSEQASKNLINDRVNEALNPHQMDSQGLANLAKSEKDINLRNLAARDKFINKRHLSISGLASLATTGK